MKLFTCPTVPEKIELRLTKESCARYYYLSHKHAGTQPYNYSAIFDYCINCKTGKENFEKLDGKLKITKKETKNCKLYKVAPDKCLSEEYDGVFPRKRNQCNAIWRKVKFCSPHCCRIYSNLKKEI